MPAQYMLSSSPSIKGYVKIENAPVVLAAQLSLDLANLVGEANVYPKNPILANIFSEIATAISVSEEIGPWLKGEEFEFLRAAKNYIGAIQTQNNNSSIYNKLIESLGAAISIKIISE